MRRLTRVLTALFSVLSIACASTYAQSKLHSETADQDLHRDVREFTDAAPIFGTGKADAANFAALLAAVETADKAEKQIQEWEAGAPARKQVRASLDMILAMRAVALSFNSGRLTAIDHHTLLKTVDDFASAFSRDTEPAVWRDAQILRLQVLQLNRVFLSANISVAQVDRDIASLLADPLFSDRLQSARLRYLRANSAIPGTYGLKIGTPQTLEDLTFAASVYEEEGYLDEATEAYLTLAGMLLSDRLTLKELPPLLPALQLEQIISNLRSIPLSPEHTVDLARLEFVHAHVTKNDAALIDRSKTWFEATLSLAEAAGSPLWESSAHQVSSYFSAPVMGQNRFARMTIERHAEAAEILRTQPIRGNLMRLDNASWTRPTTGSIPEDSDLFERLGVDAITLVVELPRTAAVYKLATGRRTADNVSWRAADAGMEPYDPLGSEVSRGGSSIMSAIVDLGGNDPTFSALAAMMSRIGSVQSLVRPDEADGRIYQKFGAPLDAELGGYCYGNRSADSKIPRILLIVPPSISHVPIHLSLGPNGKRLIDCYEFSYAPDLWSALRSADQRSRSKPLAIVEGVWDPDGSLPGAVAERALSVQSVKGAATFNSIGQRQFKTTLSAPENPGRVIHVAAHGSVSLLAPYESAIHLGPGGRLFLIDLLEGRFKANADLVVLSACESGVSGMTFGPIGSYSLPAGFLRAGASGVVGALWKVDDDAAALVMGRFYRNLFSEGMAPAKALREAQLWLSTASEDELIDLVQAALSDAPASDHGALAVLANQVVERAERSATPYSGSSLWGAFAYFGAGSQ